MEQGRGFGCVRVGMDSGRRAVFWEKLGRAAGAWICLRVRVWVKAREPYCEGERGRSIRSWWAIILATRLQQHKNPCTSVVCVGGQIANHSHFLWRLRESSGSLESRPAGAFRRSGIPRCLVIDRLSLPRSWPSHPRGRNALAEAHVHAWQPGSRI